MGTSTSGVYFGRLKPKKPDKTVGMAFRRISISKPDHDSPLRSLLGCHGIRDLIVLLENVKKFDCFKKKKKRMYLKSILRFAYDKENRNLNNNSDVRSYDRT